ncbi:MAG: class I SAM-dependent methyltransferase [Pseudomonadota bacterium]
MSGFVGAQHEFHDAEFVRGWASRFVPTEPRLQLFDMILDQVNALGKEAPHVVELGTGPGYMARHILERNATLSYEALDFSEVFFDVARETIGDLVQRVTFTNADLMDQAWPKKLSRQPDAIISTWALHDLGGRAPVADVYARCYETLPVGGVLVNGDFIKPDGTSWEYEPGRFEIDIHLDFLRQAGFSDPKSTAHLEPNIDTPTAAENYACLVAMR